MARAQQIAAQIGSLKELLEIIAALRAIAAVQMQRSQQSLEAVRDYSRVIRRALGEAAALVARGNDSAVTTGARQPGLVVLCSEHGFCGAFNEPLISAAIEAARTERNLHLIFVGTRGAQRASERGLSPELTLPMAPHSDGVTQAAHRVAVELSRMFVAQTLTSVEVLYTHEVRTEHSALARVRLLPPDWPVSEKNQTKLSPIVNMKPRRLFDELAAEYMFAMLEAAAMESFASENAARFRTMEAAHENIEKKITEFDRTARRMRQESVTTEILDLIAGFEAMTSR
jgi:F-type H+-transporting ATPase subunit gamma